VTGELLSGVFRFLKSCLGRASNFKQACAPVENSDVFWRVAETFNLQLVSFQEDCYVQKIGILVIVVGLWTDGLGPGHDNHLGLG